MSVIIKSGFLSDVSRYFEALPDIAATAARLALNDTAERKGLKMIRADMDSQINFPQGYLLQNDRLGVSRRATNNNLQVVITARDRPTSLARFAPGQSQLTSKGRQVVVSVQKGRSKVLKKAFFVNLRNGNVGLAVRVREGDTLRNSSAAVQLAKNVYLLYGPSVDQVFRTVAENSVPELSKLATDEFFRQFIRLSRNGK